MAHTSENWQPRPRLRHLEAVTLRSVNPRGTPICHLSLDTRVLFQLHRLRGGASCVTRELLYTSEQLPIDFDLCWDYLQPGALQLPEEQLNAPCDDELQLDILVADPGTPLALRPTCNHHQQHPLDEGLSGQQQMQLPNKERGSHLHEQHQEAEAPPPAAPAERPMRHEQEPLERTAGLESQVHAAASDTHCGDSRVRVLLDGERFRIAVPANGSAAAPAAHQAPAAGESDPEAGPLRVELHGELLVVRLVLPASQDQPSAAADVTGGEHAAAACDAAGGEPRGAFSTAGEPAEPVAAAATAEPRVWLSFRFTLEALRLLPAARLGLPSPAPNQPVLRMSDGHYCLPDAPAPQPCRAAAAAAGSDAGGGADAEEQTVVAEGTGMPSKGSGRARRASLGKQQALFRWMLSANSSVLGGLEPQHSDGSGSATAHAATLCVPGLGGGFVNGELAADALGREELARPSEHMALQQGGMGSFLASVFGGGAPEGGGDAAPLPVPAAAVGVAERRASHASAGPSGATGVARNYDAAVFWGETQRLITLQMRVEDAKHRCAGVKERLQQLLSSRHQAQQQQLQLRDAHARVAVAKLETQQLSAALEGMRRRQRQRQDALQAQLAALKEGVAERSNGRAALRGAEERLAGPSGEGAWRALHARLVGRRNRLVADLASAYCIGPMTDSALDSSNLADTLDSIWSGAADSSGASDDGEARGTRGEARSVTPPPAARLLIAGLELPSSLARRGLEGSVGWTAGAYDGEQRVAAALGYMAAAVERCAVYLGVPLRFPLLPRCNRSAVVDPAPVHLEAADRQGLRKGRTASDTHSPVASAAATGPTQPGGTAGPSVGGAAPAAVAAVGPPCEVLPLYYEAGDRTRFAYALFLLNKDVEQLLNAHGLSSAGPNQLLPNLYKLVSAATSAFPPAPPVVGEAPPARPAGGAAAAASTSAASAQQASRTLTPWAEVTIGEAEASSAAAAQAAAAQAPLWAGVPFVWADSNSSAASSSTTQQPRQQDSRQPLLSPQGWPPPRSLPSMINRGWSIGRS